MNGEVSPEIQALHQVYLFHTFSTEELENILEHAEIASYHPGEKFMKWETLPALLSWSVGRCG